MGYDRTSVSIRSASASGSIFAKRGARRVVPLQCCTQMGLQSQLGKLSLPRGLYAIHLISQHAYSSHNIKAAWARCGIEAGKPLNHHMLLEERHHELYKSMPSRSSVRCCSRRGHPPTPVRVCMWQVKWLCDESAWVMPTVACYARALDIPKTKCNCGVQVLASHRHCHCPSCGATNASFDAAAAVAARVGRLAGWRKCKAEAAKQPGSATAEDVFCATFIGDFSRKLANKKALQPPRPLQATPSDVSIEDSELEAALAEEFGQEPTADPYEEIEVCRSVFSNRTCFSSNCSRMGALHKANLCAGDAPHRWQHRSSRSCLATQHDLGAQCCACGCLGERLEGSACRHRVPEQGGTLPLVGRVLPRDVRPEQAHACWRSGRERARYSGRCGREVAQAALGVVQPQGTSFARWCAKSVFH